MFWKPTRVLAFACASLLVASACAIAGSADTATKTLVPVPNAAGSDGLSKAAGEVAYSGPVATSPAVDVTSPGKKKAPTDPAGSVVPEPSTMITLFCGMAGIGSVIWRRRRR